MRAWRSLAESIHSIKEASYQWPNDSSPENRDQLVQMDLMMLQKLGSLLYLPVSGLEKEKAARFFLWIRGKVFVNTRLDYTLHPSLPSNLLCLEIARKIAKPDETICQILMPTVRHVYGTSVDASDVKIASEDPHAGFVPSQYLMHADGCALTAVSDLFEYACNDTDLLFSPKRSVAALSADDIARMRSVAGVRSEVLFDTLEQIHRVKTKHNNSIGSAVLELAEALVEASRAGSGSEFSADISMCRPPVLTFYNLWKSFAPTRLANIKDRRISAGSAFGLQSYLLCLFVRLKEHIPEITVNAAEVRRVMREDIFPCAELIAGQLKAIVAANPDLLTSPVSLTQPLENTERLPTPERMSELVNRFKSALHNRPPLIGLRDGQCLAYEPMVTVFANQFFDAERMSFKIRELVEMSHMPFDVAHVLVLLPTHHWQEFLTKLRDKIRSVFRSNAYAYEGISLILKQQHESDWPHFFDALYQSDNADLLSEQTLIPFLTQFSERRWPALVNAMEPLYQHLLPSAIEVVLLFGREYWNNWENYYTALKAPIDRVLADSLQASSFIVLMPINLWPNVARVFGAVISAHIQSEHFLVQTLSPLNELQKTVFLDWLSTHFSAAMDFTPRKMIAVLKVLGIAFFKDFFRMLGNDRIARYISTPVVIMTFLKLLDTPAQRRACLEALSPYVSGIPIDFVQMYALTHLFPECRQTALDAFVLRLPGFIFRLAETLRVYQVVGMQESEQLLFFFNFYATIALPHLLNTNNLLRLCPSFGTAYRHAFHGDLLSPAIIAREFQALDDAVRSGAMTQTTVTIQKIETLADYVQHVAQLNESDLLADELTTVFGRDFFSTLFGLRDYFERTAISRVATVSASTQTENVARPDLHEPLVASRTEYAAGVHPRQASLRDVMFNHSAAVANPSVSFFHSPHRPRSLLTPEVVAMAARGAGHVTTVGGSADTGRVSQPVAVHLPPTLYGFSLNATRPPRASSSSATPRGRNPQRT